MIVRWKTVPDGGARNRKSPLATVERLNGGTASWLEQADRSLCRDGTSVTRVKYDDRYAGALPFTRREVATASLNRMMMTNDDETDRRKDRQTDREQWYLSAMCGVVEVVLSVRVRHASRISSNYVEVSASWQTRLAMPLNLYIIIIIVVVAFIYQITVNNIKT